MGLSQEHTGVCVHLPRTGGVFFNTVTFPALVAILNLNSIFKVTIIPFENSGSDSQIMCNTTHLASRGSKLLIDL